MALLSGCDYTRGLPGVGLAMAHKAANQFPVISTYIKRQFTNGPELELFQREMRLANAVFRFQTVFDPKTRALVSLHDLTDDVPWDDKVQAHVGRHVDARLAAAIARGKVCPRTMRPVKDEFPHWHPESDREYSGLVEKFQCGRARVFLS
ncbi:hypothetical protein AURDEDRAFT_121746 [Auricularia subglabra TFB-10046 SS5]|nr:hypothetical protein AURDEDRAFT_121746 [Auricularia subglabra TFB-10046 SS5]